MTREEAHEELIELFENYPVSHKQILRLINKIFDDIDNIKTQKEKNINGGLEDDHY